jgi:hypothetical protein
MLSNHVPADIGENFALEGQVTPVLFVARQSLGVH